jgi:hypothetical protein
LTEAINSVLWPLSVQIKKGIATTDRSKTATCPQPFDDRHRPLAAMGERALYHWPQPHPELRASRRDRATSR